MPDLVIPDVEDLVIDLLRERAKTHGRSVEVEARTILHRAVAEKSGDPWAVVNALREELARTGRSFPDSTEMIREDRDR